jgi:hypothetical protein
MNPPLAGDDEPPVPAIVPPAPNVGAPPPAKVEFVPPVDPGDPVRVNAFESGEPQAKRKAATTQQRTNAIPAQNIS